MSVAIIARGAVSALGLGASAFDPGRNGEEAPSAWGVRSTGRAFARVASCSGAPATRPRVLLELALVQLVAELDRADPGWRSRRVGVIVGSANGGFAALERALRGDEDAWEHACYFAPLTEWGETLGLSSARKVALYGACSSSALALGLGKRWLEQRRFDLVIAGGYDAESELVCAGFDSLKATAVSTPRPFRAERDGMVLGEGAALVALTLSAERAYGYVRGFGASTDAVHITAPDRSGSGLALAAERSIADSGLTRAEIDLVSVHGTGTLFNDAAEASALSALFGPRAHELPLHAFKASIGHTLGAASALEALSALSAMERRLLPASAGSGQPMPGLPCRLLERSRPGNARACLKLSTAFGGANAALVLSLEPGPPLARSPRSVHVVCAGAEVTELEPARLSGLLAVGPEKLPRSDPLSRLAVAAAGSALLVAASQGVELDRSRVGVIVGSAAATLECNAAFAERALRRGPEHAEPRRFPATSPNASAGHVAIAFGLRGPSHAVGAGEAAALEALEVARDWVSSGDAEAVLVVAAEHVGPTSTRALAAVGLTAPDQGGLAVLLAAEGGGPALTEALLREAARHAVPGQCSGFRGLLALVRAAGLRAS